MIIDLLLRNTETGEYWLIDHKSAPYPFRKDGTGVLAKYKKSFESYKRQMYLYCHAVKQLYGEFPQKITWNHFKEKKLATIPFQMEEYEDTIKRQRVDVLFNRWNDVYVEGHSEVVDVVKVEIFSKYDYTKTLLPPLLLILSGKRRREITALVQYVN